MSFKYLVTFCCLTSILSASAQFEWSNPQPSGYLNNKVVFTSASTGFIMNSNGDLMKTSNSGVNWNKLNYFPRCSALDAKGNFLVIGGADTTVYISSDGAQSWKKGIIKQDNVIEKIQIINEDTVFALSINSNISTSALYRSTDGALTWQLVSSTPPLKTFDFIDGRLGYGTSYGTVFKTTNGGITWDTLYKNNVGYGFLNIEFFDRDLGFAYKEFDGIFKTTDGGVNWTKVLASTYGRVYSFGFASASIVFAVGEDGTLYRSTDSGQNWEFRYNHTGDRFGIYSCYFTSSTTGYFVGLRGVIFKTIDGGNSYIDYSPAYNDVRPLSFPTPSIGYAGVWQELFKTTDAGQSWTKLPFIAGEPLYKRFYFLHFFSADTGFALAEAPVRLYKTTNGGLDWVPVDLPVPYNLTDHINGFFVVKNTIYISIDDAGYSVFQSTDRGETWRTQNYSSTDSYRDLFFVDEKTGYGILGPYLYKTTDSAKTWTKILTSSSSSYNCVWFVNPAVGYLGGGGGANYQTLDSGKTWKHMPIYPDNSNFYDVFAIRFFNEKVGYLTSGYGGIYKTFNGGRTWKAEKGGPWDCHTIEMTSDTTLFIGGDYGTLLKKDMREYDIDSLAANLEATCNARVTANVTAALSQVDSIWVEYGAGGQMRTIQSNPLSVKDSTVKCDVLLQGLSSDSIYRVRIKVYYRNNYYFSDSITFRPNGLPKPVITLSGTALSSSAASGNQWFLNGNPIAGATNKTYQPATQGTYTVQQKLNGCTSSMSMGFNYTATAIIDPVLAESIQILPNPVRTTLWIKNRESKKLRITVVDIGGRIIRVIQTSKTEELINVQSLSAGIYTLLIEDLNSHRKTGSKLVKW